MRGSVLGRTVGRRKEGEEDEQEEMEGRSQRSEETAVADWSFLASRISESLAAA